MWKKVVSVCLAMITVLGLLSVSVSAKVSEEADRHLQYGSDGKFRIMQVSDIQDDYPLKTVTKKILHKALQTNEIDLVVLTGDNVSARLESKLAARWAINEYMSIFESYGVPVAMTFGNHDDQETPATKEYQLSVYEEYKCFVGCAGEDLGDTNLCTYYVPIYSSENRNKMVSNVWMIDSGTYNTENDKGGYAATTVKQIEWYKQASEKLEKENGHKIPSLMFQHIIVPEVFEVLEHCPDGTPGSVGEGNGCLKLPDGTVGELNEWPCPPGYNNGQFDAVCERGDVMAMFFGHDHVNSFELEYKGVGIINTPGAGCQSYNGWNEGVRIITLDEKNPWTFETEVQTYFDLFDFDDPCARYLFKMHSTTSDTPTKIASFFKYVAACVLSIFVIKIK